MRNREAFLLRRHARRLVKRASKRLYPSVDDRQTLRREIAKARAPREVRLAALRSLSEEANRD